MQSVWFWESLPCLNVTFIFKSIGIDLSCVIATRYFSASRLNIEDLKAGLKKTPFST